MASSSIAWYPKGASSHVHVPVLKFEESDESLSLRRDASSHSPSVSPPSGVASYPDLNRRLTLSSSHRSRLTGPLTLPPFNNSHPISQTNSAISDLYNNYNYNTSQDVLHNFVNASPDHKLSNSSARYNVPHPTPFEGSFSSFPSTSPSHGPLNCFPERLRTPQVFHSTSDLAAHYGIPQFLPPAPRTTPRRISDPEESISSSEPSTAPLDFDFANLCSNYLNMLSQKPGENQVTDGAAAAASVNDSAGSASDADAVQALMDVLQASPEFQMGTDFNDFLTSPFDESPWDDERLLTTPLLDSANMDAEILTSPILADYSGGIGQQSLFSDTPGFDYAPYPPASKPAAESTSTKPSVNFDDMYTMPSPITPSLDPTSLYPSPRLPGSKPLSPTSRRKSSATGTRKNVTPESLVPVDAPIQPRKYVTPSSTSRKEIPAVFARKRGRSQAFGDDEDELLEDAVVLPPNATEKEIIEAKRKQNTIAARRSRRRKLEYQKQLEDTNEQLRQEVDMWKSRAVTCQALLQSHGIESPVWD